MCWWQRASARRRWIPLRDALNLRVESERQLQRGVLAAQSDLHRFSEREFREKQLEQEARLRETQLEATEQRLLNQRLIVAVVALAALLAGSVAVWQLQRARRFRRRADTDSLTGVLSRSAIRRHWLPSRASVGRGSRIGLCGTVV